MQKIDKILIGTHNKGKFIEISDLLPRRIKKISPLDLGISSPVENGKTFKDNSEIKANFFCKNSNLVSLSDDSGLEVESLNGEPGIFSSRFADDLGGFNNAMVKILEKVKKINTIKWPDGKIISETGIIEGDITSIKGKNGFGYDPIFIPKGYSKTFAEMKYKEKLKIDHRSIAYQKLYNKIKNYF